MRTTIILEDELGARLREQARKEGKSFSAFLADAGRRALETDSESEKKPFRLITYRGSGPARGFDLDRTSELLAAEDQETYGARSE